MPGATAVTCVPSRDGAVSKILLALIALAAIAAGTSQDSIAGEGVAKVVAAAGCPAGTNFETEGYRIRTTRVVHPFSFTGWIANRIRDSGSDAAAALQGKPFRYDDVRRVSADIEAKGWNPQGGGSARVRVLASFTRVENCADKQVDVVYQIFSSSLSRSWSATIESRRQESDAPQTAAGMDTAKPPRFRLAPYARYNLSEKFAAGARLAVRVPAGRSTTLTAEGLGSATTRRIAASLQGSHAGAGRIANAEWRIDYLNRVEPSREATSFGQSRLAVLVSAETSPLGASGAVLRFGGALEGGGYRAFARAPGSSYGAMKLFAGASLRGAHQVFSSSYGFEAGSRMAGTGIDWRKHITDTAHEFWWPVADHKPLEIESRLTSGILQGAGRAPAAARFFGGNREHEFLPGEQWSIRSNPVLRGVPANRLVSANGQPLDRFTAFNATIAMAVWNKPLVPGEISRDPAFDEVLETGLGSAESASAAANVGKDPGLVAASEKLVALRTALQSWRESQGSAGPAACLTAIRLAERRAREAFESDPADRFGTMRELIQKETGPSVLDRAFTTCGNQSTDLAALAADMKSAMKRINIAAAEKLAVKEMVPARRALRTILKEMNLFSISPLFIADAARVPGALPANRYALGGGVRLSFVSHVLLDAGYAWHLNRGPGEDSGALFFTIRLRELIQ